MKPSKTLTLLIIILIFVILCVYHICFKLELFKLKLRQIQLDDERRFDDTYDDGTYLIHKMKQVIREKYKIKYIKKKILAINDRQHISSGKVVNSTLLEALDKYKNITGVNLQTVIVIQAHGNGRYVRVLVNSLRRVIGIHESLLIFAHDFYDAAVYNYINTVNFSRVLQIFYPYSVQLHPYRFPGQDVLFCPRLFHCKDSNERDPIGSQSKLFWWWMVNEVFGHVEVLKNYNGYIYFLEAEQYVTPDFVITAKVLEKRRPEYCPECSILSLAFQPPRPELYSKNFTALIVGIWGWSSARYISSGIGFNRTTWNEIRRLKGEYCYFNDVSWETSLKHVAAKSSLKQFYMLSVEGPRVFRTNDCPALGDTTDCDIITTYKDIVAFIRTSAKGMFPSKVRLEFDVIDGVANMDAIAENGGWEDARDRELCMFMASCSRPVYF